MKVLISELIWRVGIDKLIPFSEVEYDPTLWKNREALLQQVQEADALIVRNQTRVDAELLHAGSDDGWGDVGL